MSAFLANGCLFDGSDVSNALLEEHLGWIYRLVSVA